MQWVANKHFPAAVIFTLLASALFISFSTGSISLEPQLKPTLSCFDESTLSILDTTVDQCQPPLVLLGSGAISESATAEGEVNELHPLLQARFDAAAITAEQEGVHLYITSGYRDEKRQGALFAAAVNKYGSESEAAKWVLPPQFSHHPHGLAIDVNYPGDRKGAEWLDRNGARFGLCRVYANEWWHFEGVIAPGEKCPAMAPNALVDMR